MLRGIDVSAYQSSTYSTEGLSFVFIKATEGRSYTNPKLSAQTKDARDAGLVVGFYHFLWPGNLTAQAEYFVKHAPEKGATSSRSTGRRRARAPTRATRRRTASSAR